MVLQMPMEHVSLGPTATSSASPKQKPPWRPVVLLNRQRIDADANVVSGIEREMSLPELHSVSTTRRGLPRGGPVLRILRQPRMSRSGPDFFHGAVSPNAQEARILIDEGIPGPVLGREPKEEVLSGARYDEAPRALPSLVGSNAPAHWRRKVGRSRKLATAYHLRMKELDDDPAEPW
mmetsp:Transcript_25399/g.41232  ORF Transcript_25399/g.41232 Transcript_25399/m.41232 type:complete len:178 (-) Transcript_25399:81-614(-)